MPAATLDEVRRLADDLSPPDQVRLVQHLLSHLAQVVAATESAPSPPPSGDLDAWEEFVRIGDQLSEASPEAQMLTAALLSMRR